MPMRVFISHAHADEDVASSIIDLVMRAFCLKQSEIRCTSVPGFMLSGGEKIEDTLRNEVLNAHVVISILTPVSLASVFVLFELGARWGKGNPIMPVLSKGLTARRVPRPLSQLHSIELYEEASGLQFLEDLSEVLGIAVEKPSSLYRQIEKVISFSDVETSPRLSTTQNASAALCNLSESDRKLRLNILACFKDDDTLYDTEISTMTNCPMTAVRFYLDEMVGERLLEIPDENSSLGRFKITHEGKRFWLTGP
jgi:predicted transcriptional regulator